MTDRELQRQLENLQGIHAPKNVHTFIGVQTAGLSEKHQGVYMPLVAFRMGFALAVVLLFVMATSGVVVAAAKSEPGSLLYPVKRVMQTIPVAKQLLSTPTVIPPTPTHAVKPTDTPIPTKEQKNKEGDNQQSEQKNNNGKDVKGISTEVSVPTRMPEYPRPTHAQERKFFHFSFDFFQHGKDRNK